MKLIIIIKPYFITILYYTRYIKARENSTTIRLSGKYKSVEELRNLVISSQNGAQIRLGDVADVQDAQKDVAKISRINQKSSILLQVIKQSDANAVEVSKKVKAALAKIEKDYAKSNLKLKVANDSSEFTLTAADSVIHDLFLAVILVAFVMLFFLHSLRNALIVMVSIPASLIATFIGISLMGYTLNLTCLS